MKNEVSDISGKLYIVDDVDVERKFLSVAKVYIKKVLYNDPATVVFWSDGTKTVSKCYRGDIYSKETGLSVCILKKFIGPINTKKLFLQWLPEKDQKYVALSDVRKKLK